MNDKKNQKVELKKNKTLRGVKVENENDRFEVEIEPSAVNGDYNDKDDAKKTKTLTATKVRKGSNSNDESNKSVKVEYKGGHLKKTLRLTEVVGKKVTNTKNVW